uniref:Uncharacterized protein n=1 Tax=Ditylenchus dipsaci TaxID=166011 RepID=A0A915D811_9BILA
MGDAGNREIPGQTMDHGHTDVHPMTEHQLHSQDAKPKYLAIRDKHRENDPDWRSPIQWLIRHTCDRYQDNPGRVQYHAEIRDDIPYKNPSNKGTNKNFPDLIDNRLKAEPIPWTHKNVESFIANVDAPNAKIRYLPQSNAIHQPPSFTA